MPVSILGNVNLVETFRAKLMSCYSSISAKDVTMYNV